MSASYNVLTVRSQLIITGATVTNVGTLTFPTITTTIVGRNTTDALTNKTITSSTMNDSTNTVGANNLYNGSTWTFPLAGSSPTDQQVLTFVAGSSNIQFVNANSGGVTTGTVVTTTATPATVQTVATTSNTVYNIVSTVVARRTDAATEGFSSIVTASFKNVAGTVTQIGGTGNTSIEVYADTGVTDTWSVGYTISGTNVTIVVTGQTGKTISWNSFTVARSV